MQRLPAMSSQLGRSYRNSSDLVRSQLHKRGLGQVRPREDEWGRVGTSGDEFAETLVGVVGQQRGALLARGSTVNQKKPNDE
jgi:hypothetical protein